MLKGWANRNYNHNQNKLTHYCYKTTELETRLWNQPFNPYLVDHIQRLTFQREKLLLFGQAT